MFKPNQEFINSNEKLQLKIAPPLGRDVLKFICSSDPINLKALKDHRSKIEQSVPNPLKLLNENLFFERDHLRGGNQPIFLNSSEGLIETITFDINPFFLIKKH